MAIYEKPSCVIALVKTQCCLKLFMLLFSVEDFLYLQSCRLNM